MTGSYDTSDYTFGKMTSRTQNNQNQSFDNYTPTITKTGNDSGIYDYSKRIYDNFKDNNLAGSVRGDFNKTAGKKIGEVDASDSLQGRSISNIRK